MHLMALGMFLFEIGTLAYDDLQRKADFQHARSGRVGARDATQFVGLGDETVSLSGGTYAELADGRVSLDDLRTMGATGDAWPLVTGGGDVYGNYVILAVDERQTQFLPDGTPLRIDFGVDLLRVDDPSEDNNKETAA